MEILAILTIGAILGWAARGRYHPPPKYHRQRRIMEIVMDTWYSAIPSHGFKLRSIDPERLAAIASRVNHGRIMSFRNMTGRHKLFSQTQWAKVREELIACALMAKGKDGSLSPTPEGRIFFAKVRAPKRTEANTPKFRR